jgi:hypothetical protein
MHYSLVYMGWEVSQDFTNLKSVVENQNQTHAWKLFHEVMELERFSAWRQKLWEKKLALIADLLYKELCVILIKGKMLILLNTFSEPVIAIFFVLALMAVEYVEGHVLCLHNSSCYQHVCNSVPFCTFCPFGHSAQCHAIT